MRTRRRRREEPVPGRRTLRWERCRVGVEGAAVPEPQALGQPQAGVRIDRRPAGLVDLEVEVCSGRFGVAAVAGVGDDLAGRDLCPDRDAGGEGVLQRVQAVVGARRVVVDVDVPVLPALGVAQHQHVALARRAVVDVDPPDGGVDHGQQRPALRHHEVVALVDAAAPGIAEVVAVAEAALDRHGDPAYDHVGIVGVHGSPSGEAQRAVGHEREATGGEGEAAEGWDPGIGNQRGVCG